MRRDEENDILFSNGSFHTRPVSGSVFVIVEELRPAGDSAPGFVFGAEDFSFRRLVAPAHDPEKACPRA
jgi:hypothetical protein